MQAHLPVVIVLAAGRSSRFRASGGGGSKLHADLDGMTVLEHVLAAVERSGLAVQLVEQAAGDAMGDSIAAGVNATRDAAGWLVLPGDLPLVGVDSIRSVAEALTNHSVAVPCYQGQKGHPVGFSRECRDALLALAGEAGGAAVVSHYAAAGRVVKLDVDDPGIVTDIDTLEDLQRVRALLAASR
ncbi:nucleotidyltransferase family protein [Phytopseudomonas punonensis]|uniref:Molybdenum cofactor cytidylyltransferase n=1 Tax=Phytopseudomonas punonensis TaxID=1220495 RepID=A0A1M6XHR5_9GAMM|nr:NTP transferase domain-containing protein [Pseudomonas punonensis]SHL05491.1 molybdenum cofactor cytidylyltransferase [Pseudomonas punonensis]